MTVLVVSGTGTDVGKTVVTAAIAALARADGRRVAVIKAAQTGVGPSEPGDLAAVARLAGVTALDEGARFAPPLSPETAARLSGRTPVDLTAVAATVRRRAADHDLVLVEGAGGLLVRYDDTGRTLADLAADLGAPVLVVVRAALGTLNDTTLTLEALQNRGVECGGLVIGAWPPEPGLAERCNVTDLQRLSGRTLDGAVPAGAGGLAPEPFTAVARSSLGPRYGGTFDPRRLLAASPEGDRVVPASG